MNQPDGLRATDRLKFLVTGGAGFIGSHLVDRLLAEGHRVTVLDNLSTGSMANIAQVSSHPHFQFVQGSVLSQLTTEGLVGESDVVVHLAAAVGVELVVNQPLKSFITNVRGTEVILDAAHRHRRKVLLASTSEVYGKNDDIRLAEDSDRTLGSAAISRWGYALSKMADEFLATRYWAELGLPVVIARFFNTVGPRQSPMYGMVIPRMVHQALSGEPLTVYGDGLQTRCFCHVEDTVQALTHLLENETAVGETFNVGASSEISMLDLAKKIISLTNSRSEIRLVPYEEAFPNGGFEDMRRRVPDTSKLESLTGWRSKRSLDDIILQSSYELS